MSVQDSLKEALATMLREEYNIDAVKVIDWADEIERSGYCETCYYEEQVVNITYVDSDGDSHLWTYCGMFSGLMRLL